MTAQVYIGAGTHIARAATMLVEAAKNGDGEAVGEFNGIELRATRETTPQEVAAMFDRKSAEAAEAYRRSPEGIAAEERRQQGRRDAQAKHDTLITRLPLLNWGDDVAVLDWCCAMQDPSDTVGVIVKRDTILAEFAKHGFTPNMRTGSDYIEDSRLVSHAYLVGQALAGIESVAIHHILHKFAAEWKERFGVAP